MYSFSHSKEVQLVYTSLHKQIYLKLMTSTGDRVLTLKIGDRVIGEIN